MGTASEVLSVYRFLTVLDEEHSVVLVQHIHSRKLFVQKRLKVYSRPVFDYLRLHPVPNMPRIYELAEEEGALVWFAILRIRVS